MCDARLVRSMSRKGCSPDSAACEGFFGRLKSELFCPRDWRPTTVKRFVEVVDYAARQLSERRLLRPVSRREYIDGPLDYLRDVARGRVDRYAEQRKLEQFRFIECAKMRRRGR